MLKNKNKQQPSEQEYVNVDDGFVPGDAYPNCEGEPCVNVSDTIEEDIAKSAAMAGASAKRAGKEHKEHKGVSKADAERFSAECAEWRDKYLRLSAEFDNYRKRTLREKMELITAGGEEVIKALLPVIDDIDRALAAMAGAKDVEAVRTGVELIAQKLRDMLQGKGLSEIEALGRELDTDLHEAVARFAAGEQKRGKIVDVVQKGYKLKDKVVRYAKVVVGE